MKRILSSLLGLATLLLTGCVVTSVYPYYTERDLVFEPELLGRWSENETSTDEAKGYWKFDKAGEKAYGLLTVENSETNYYSAHLFRIKRQTFLDLCKTNAADDQLSLHYLLKVTQIEPSLQYQIMDYGWLGELVQTNSKAIRHIVVPVYDDSGDTNKARLVLTADTKELQKFILKYSSDTNAFGKAEEMKRRKE